MNELVQKALYGGAIPVGGALLLAAVALWLHKRGLAGRRVAAWIVPVAAAIGFGVSYVALFNTLDGRWRWVVPAVLTTLPLWALAVAVWPKSNRHILTTAGIAAAVLGATAGLLAMRTFYAHQPARLAFIPFTAVALLAVSLYPIAVRDARPADGLAVAAAAGMLAPTIVFSHNAYLGELTATLAAAAGAASLLGLLVRGDRFAEWHRGLSAGALGVALPMPVLAIVAWNNAYDPPSALPWALSLPCAAPLLLWAARVPTIARRPVLAGVIAFALVAGVAAAGFALSGSQTEVEAYQMPY